MKLEKYDAQNIVWNDHEDWEEIETKITDHDRWSVYYEGVYKHKPSEKFYSVIWAVGATEQQDMQPFEYEKEVEFTEVHQVEKVVKVWEPVT